VKPTVPAKSPAPDVKAVPPGKVEPKVKDVKTQLQQELQEAAKLETQLKYTEAMKSYKEALQLSPKDAQALAGLRRAELNWRVSEGQKHLDAKRYVEATREFEAALVLAPNNAAIQKLLAKAKQAKN
jgi:tetratricopeptide (TPR) repeat protein